MSDFLLKAFFVLGGLFFLFMLMAFMGGRKRKSQIKSGDIFNFSYYDIKLPNDIAKEVFNKLKEFYNENYAICREELYKIIGLPDTITKASEAFEYLDIQNNEKAKEIFNELSRAIHKRYQIERQPIEGYSAEEVLQQFQINIKDNERVLEQ